ncbi:MAG: type II secretion system F family protein [Firmicutes bacterium]|nr:type II secretion system F family protein [Bacillota bacterium]
MIWILIGLEVIGVTGGIVLYALRPGRIRDEPRKGITRFLYAVGEWIVSKIPLSHRMNEVTRLAGSLHPQMSARTAYRRYAAERAGQMYGLMLLTNLLLIFGIGGAKASVDVGYEVQRPAYGEADRTETLVAVDEEGREAEIRISVPHQAPNPEQARQAIQEAAKDLLERTERLKKTAEAFILPTQLGEVTVQYTSDEEVWIGSDGYVRWRTEPLGQEQWFEATLSLAGEEEIYRFMILHERILEADFREQVEEAVNLAELTDDTFVLPDQAEGRRLMWETPDEQKGIGRMILLLWLLPLGIIPLGRSELRHMRKDRNKRMEASYPLMLQKLTIYLSAGLSIQAAWERIAQKGDPKDPLMEEMRVTRVQIRNGMSVQTAFLEFGKRVQNAELRRLANMLCRDLRRGNEYLLDKLTELNRQAWDRHRKTIQIQSEETETKMLIPMMLMLGAILLIVMTPAMLTLRL